MPSGVAIVDFGAFPGSSHAFTDVVTAGVVSTSRREAYIEPAASTDHSVDEHMVETLKAFAEFLSNDNLRLHLLNTSQLNEPVSPPRSSPYTAGGRQKAGQEQGGGRGTRIYGKWNVGWAWT